MGEVHARLYTRTKPVMHFDTTDLITDDISIVVGIETNLRVTGATAHQALKPADCWLDVRLHGHWSLHLNLEIFL